MRKYGRSLVKWDSSQNSTQKMRVLDCSGLAYLEQWHYSVFQSDGTCSLGKISNESETVTDGTNQKININIDELGDVISVFTLQSHNNRYSSLVYEIFENIDDTEQCNIHCYFDGSQKCDFYFVYDDKCYFGNFDTDQNDHNYAFSYQQMYIMKGEHIITHH
jgi:hypothetical protein